MYKNVMTSAILVATILLLAPLCAAAPSSGSSKAESRDSDVDAIIKQLEEFLATIGKTSEEHAAEKSDDHPRGSSIVDEVRATLKRVDELKAKVAAATPDEPRKPRGSDEDEIAGHLAATEDLVKKLLDVVNTYLDDIVKRIGSQSDYFLDQLLVFLTALVNELLRFGF
ncbi:unnamed protein product [Vitrella brassicaformis CCMP3155]|uniref:Uncharacterized protein n=1 Tax=Vitrella brassicaformis (strain CCMP3155) TaxID=1169540 RepID=A0A0G4EKJ7_VITBC|nr:unnamed protein product [Vitrella brassicaformis CCMP3155]|eukprot:CEL97082.1 unnamed protein product [Vitrella brassicaformis CCMP3155]